MAKAILIDPRDTSIRYVDCEATGDAMRAMIGGSLQIAHIFPSGDVLYVDEEGLLKDLVPGAGEKATCFCVYAHQIFAGRGLIVGKTNGVASATSSSRFLKYRFARGSLSH
ncbi:DUF3846 domain-containing protein [Sinorhizobium meliloti]|nr:DUF3846 domain-containing protein [Sinorhizobium meliloti]